jgi:hypothetical protein
LATARAEEAGETVGEEGAAVFDGEEKGPNKLYGLQFNPGLLLMMICINDHTSDSRLISGLGGVAR